MEQLLDISVFQNRPFRTIVQFDQYHYSQEPVRHAIEICVSNILEGKENISEEDLNSRYCNIFDCYDGEKSLLDKFSATEMKNSIVQEKIKEKIRYGLNNISKYEKKAHCEVIDAVRCVPESTEFCVKSGIHGITDVTFNFHITKDKGSGKTTIICTFTSALTIERKIALQYKRAKDLLLLKWKK
jgi:hypothetical protein